MRHWAMTVQYSIFQVIGVEANSYEEAIHNVMTIAEDEAKNMVNIEYVHEITIPDYEELPSNYEFADGYYDDSDEDEEFEFNPLR